MSSKLTLVPNLFKGGLRSSPSHEAGVRDKDSVDEFYVKGQSATRKIQGSMGQDCHSVQ